MVKTTFVQVMVPRYIGSTSNHVLVKLTVLHDMTCADSIIRQCILPFAVSILSASEKLPDKCERTMRLSAIASRIVEESEILRKLVPEKLHDELFSLIEYCMCDVKKYGTYVLREALTDACDELSTLQDRVSELEEEVEELKNSIGETT